MPTKYKFTRIMNWLCTTKVIGSKRKNVLFFLLRLSIGFSGCMKTHKITIKQIHDSIGLYPRAISRALYQLRDIGFIDFNQGKKLKKGGNFVVHIKQLLFNFEQDSYLKENKVQESSDKVQESFDKVPESLNKVQKRHNPPLAKDIYKETSKDTLKEGFEEFNKAWVSTYTESESFNKITTNKFDRYYAKVAYDKISDRDKMKLIESTKKYIQHFKNYPEKVQYMKKASNFINEEEWKVYYKSIEDEIRAEKQRLDRIREDQENERNKATPEEIKEALSGFLKK